MKPKYIYLLVTDHIRCESFVLGFENEYDLDLARMNYEKRCFRIWGTYRTKKDAIAAARDCYRDEWPWRYASYRNKMSAKQIG